MALNSVIYRFKIKLSDVDRGIYETLELRVAKHPSESDIFLFTRVIAYALNVQEGIEFTGGISSPDDPAIWVKDLTGVILLWIDIGSPSARRLHKAAKASKAVRIYGHRDPESYLKDIAGEEIYKRDSIELFSFPVAFLNTLVPTLQRDNTWDLIANGGEISISTKDVTAACELQHTTLN